MMERLLKNNIAVKILAFLIGLMLWVYVTGDIVQRTSIPDESRPFNNVPLAWHNLEGGLAIMDVPDQVNVVLSGRRDILDGITPQNVKPFVDLEGLGEGEYRLLPEAELPRGVRIISFNPQHVVVRLEAIEAPQKQIILDVLGEPAEGFVMGEPSIMPDSVFVRGPRSIVEKVEYVRATVSINGANQDRIQMTPVYATDAYGNIVEGVEISPAMVEVTIPFSEPQKEVFVRVPLQGDIPEGYRVQQVNIEPATVIISGPEDLLEPISEILTEPVNISELRENIILHLPIVLPSRTSSVVEEVQVEIIIQAIEIEPEDNG